MKFSAHIVATIIAAVLPLSASAQTPASPTQPPPAQGNPAPQKADNISRAVGMNELKIEMAETRLKLSKDPKIISDLASALEEYLNSTCMAKLPQTLSYAGNPSDPTCIARMQRLLEINPGNPVAICVQEGIASKPCIDAYQNQTIVVIYPSSKGDDLDPVLKVGIPAVTMERIAKVEGSLQEVNAKYQQTLTPDEKKALLNDAANLYDQILNMSCKVSAVGFVQGNSDTTRSEPEEIALARERLLQIPPAIRGDYQREMLGKAEKELANPQTSPDRIGQLKELIAVIKDPDALSKLQFSNLKRTRYILSKCAEVINIAGKIVPDLPSITCFQQGWYTPQCTYAMKKWRMQKEQEAHKAQITPGTTGPKPSMITRF
jgi:hypothetical protein